MKLFYLNLNSAKMRFFLIFCSFLLSSITILQAATISNNPSTVPIGATITATDADNINVTDLVTQLASGNVTINVTGSISIDNAITSNSGNTLTIVSDGNITVDAAVNLTGSTGTNACPGNDGQNGGSIDLSSTGGNVIVNQSIATSGGLGGNATCGGQAGGTGGQAGIITINGNDINVNASLTANGGNAGVTQGDGYGGKGGAGNTISVTAKNNLLVSGATTTITSQGGNGTVGGQGEGHGGNGGSIELTAENGTNNINILEINTTGGTAAFITSSNINNTHAGNGGSAGSVVIKSYGDLTIETQNGISAYGQAGGESNNGNMAGGAGGNAANVSLYSDSGAISLSGDVDVSGGKAGDVYNSQFLPALDAGNAGNVSIVAKQEVTLNGKITANGGQAGVSSRAAVEGLPGKIGGSVTIVSIRKDVSVNNTITANGGNGARQGNQVCGTRGGDGGAIVIEAPTGSIFNNTGGISANGGNAGEANHSTDDDYCYQGGYGGTIDIVAENIENSSSLTTNGGKGGGSGANGLNQAGQGGEGGNINLNGNVSNNGSITSNGGDGGNQYNDTSGNPQGGGLKGNVNIDGSFSGNPAVTNDGADGYYSGSGGMPTLRPLTPPSETCIVPKINGMIVFIPSFCLDSGINLDVNMPTPIVDWQGETMASVGFEIEDMDMNNEIIIGDFTTLTTLPHIITSNNENGRRIRYFATNTCGQTGHAYAVINKYCADNDLDAVISGDSTICEDGKAILTIEVTGTAPNPWTITLSDGSTKQITSSPTTMEVEPEVTTTYTITSITASDATAGTTSGFAEIIVIEKVDLTLSADKTQVTPGEKVTVTASPEYNDIIWYMNDTEFTPEFPMSVFQDIKFTAKVNDGVCEGDLSDPVFITTNWPNAIVQGGKNGVNGDFLIGSGLQLSVFNRHGIIVYEGTNGWDGKINGKYADPETYFYVVELPDGSIRKATLKVVKE
jgi:hypothetical protein